MYPLFYIPVSSFFSSSSTHQEVNVELTGIFSWKAIIIERMLSNLDNRQDSSDVIRRVSKALSGIDTREHGGDKKRVKKNVKETRRVSIIFCS